MARERTDSTRTLLRLEARRAAAALRRPEAGRLAGALIPLLAVASLLWVAGRLSAPAAVDPESGVLLGLLVGGPVSLLAYGVLFRGADDPLLRRLGIDPGALYRLRALRLLGAAVGVALLLVVPFVAAGAKLAVPLAVVLAAAAAAWGGAALALSNAGLALAGDRQGQGWGCLTAGIWDVQVRAAAPLVYAPVVPLLAAAAAGGVVGGAAGAGALRLVAVALLAVAAAAWAERAYAAAFARFSPQALEMAFEPPPADGGSGLVVGRGVGRLLPRPAAAVWARDAVVGARRYPWATRVVWPVVAAALVGLARWGGSVEARGWVATAALLVLLAQGAAVLALGRLEGRGPRWVDRATGVGGGTRLVGRWAWGWGLSLYLTLPLALAWQWWSGVGAGWAWIAAGGATSLAAAGASVAAGGR